MVRNVSPSEPELLGEAPELKAVLSFLHGIGIKVAPATLEDCCVLPGMAVRDGGLLYDPDKRGWVSDLLHEAGHLAVSDPDNAATLSAVDDDPAQEMATLAWSYAAAMAIGMPLETLFHPAYKAGAQSLIEAFGRGAYIGLPMLQHWEMTGRPGDDGPVFPAMRHWFRPRAG